MMGLLKVYMLRVGAERAPTLKRTRLDWGLDKISYSPPIKIVLAIGLEAYILNDN
jgi:hypothetical protein